MVKIQPAPTRYAPSGNKTLLTDALMSVIAQANDSQGVDNFYAYSPYGEVQTLGPDGGNSLQYTGRENDQTGLYYYRARYYDPVLKRFVSEDPIGLAGGVNLYSYVDGDPVNLSDPSGNCAYCGIVVGGVVAAFVANWAINTYNNFSNISQGVGGIIQSNAGTADFYTQVKTDSNSVTSQVAGQAVAAREQGLQGAGKIVSGAGNTFSPGGVPPGGQISISRKPTSVLPTPTNGPRYPIAITNDPVGQFYCPGYTR